MPQNCRNVDLFEYVYIKIFIFIHFGGPNEVKTYQKVIFDSKYVKF